MSNSHRTKTLREAEEAVHPRKLHAIADEASKPEIRDPLCTKEAERTSSSGTRLQREEIKAATDKEATSETARYSNYKSKLLQRMKEMFEETRSGKSNFSLFNERIY